MVIFLENVNCKTFGSLTRCKSNVDQEELNFIIDLSRPLDGLFV